MYSSTHPIIDPSDYDVEDAFSSTHSPDYILASLDYFPALPGNTSLDLQMIYLTYNATNNESPIPPLRALIAPQTIFPSSPMLPQSPMFDPQDLFLPEEILPPQKRARFLSSSSTNFSTPP
ncbi:hypothetical protein Tco_0147703 [Tanacetum coccineum]